MLGKLDKYILLDPPSDRNPIEPLWECLREKLSFPLMISFIKWSKTRFWWLLDSRKNFAGARAQDFDRWSGETTVLMCLYGPLANPTEGHSLGNKWKWHFGGNFCRPPFAESTQKWRSPRLTKCVPFYGYKSFTDGLYCSFYDDLVFCNNKSTLLDP